MEPTAVQDLASLRVLVGYLGERDQAGWWSSEFFAPASSAFLAPMFPRTQLLAQCTGVTQAAMLVHDERIGVGRHVHHLFRLPEDLEHRVHTELHNAELVQSITRSVANRDTALQALRALAHGGAVPSGVGPTRIGAPNDMGIMTRWHDVAAHYVFAIDAGVQVYPYFAERA